MSPWGWECHARMVKQVKLKPTQKRSTKWDDFVPPGPAHYPPPEIFCGRGFSKIKRAPAYSFGVYTSPLINVKQALKPNAPLFNVSRLTRKGKVNIPQGLIATRLEPPKDKTIIPGPGAHFPKDEARLKKPPKYTFRIAAKPPYEPWDQWTCPPNMYHPPIFGKKSPVYSFGDGYKRCDDTKVPGPCDHHAKYEPREKAQPAFSFGYRCTIPSPNSKLPAPNAYCHKRLTYSKKSSPAPSFGIKHSPYLGITPAYIMPSRLEHLARDLE